MRSTRAFSAIRSSSLWVTSCSTRSALDPDQGHSAVLVRHGQGPGSYTLEAVYVESLKLVLVLDESGHTQFLDKIFAGVKRVPIS